jgi:riboflavin kinase/FMN adenylyltransferase
MAVRVQRLDDSAGPLAELAAGTALVIGNFDGVHRGHQATAALAVEAASAHALVPALLTFDPHPIAVVGSDAPPVLTTLERKAELSLRLGIEHVVARDFDTSFATWSPERFARELVREALNARIVVVGDNFRFGSGRTGDFARLSELGTALGFESRVCPMLHDAHGPMSSTRARTAIAAGDLAEAELTLGRPHAISGVVEKGDARGRTLGFPTANLGAVPEMLPPNGVYAVAVDEVDPAGKARARGLGVMNIGVRPTLAGEPKRTIEAHLLDVDRDLYGARLRVHLVARLRDEKRFGGLDALKAQIARDVESARKRLAGVLPLAGAYG